MRIRREQEYRPCSLRPPSAQFDAHPARSLYCRLHTVWNLNESPLPPNYLSTSAHLHHACAPAGAGADEHAPARACRTAGRAASRDCRCDCERVAHGHACSSGDTCAGGDACADRHAVDYRHNSIGHGGREHDTYCDAGALDWQRGHHADDYAAGDAHAHTHGHAARSAGRRAADFGHRRRARLLCAG